MSYRKTPPFVFTYTNWQGVTEVRHVFPQGVVYKAYPPYYPEPLWLLTAWDLDREEVRHFDLSKIRP
jgi:predicted DNA-binding transcriptional regulator YafY